LLEWQSKEPVMTTLDLAPAIAALRERPEEFELVGEFLRHPRSRHAFRPVGEDDLQVDAHCDCSLLRASPEQSRAFRAAWRDWQASYWRVREINREFASHFAPPPLWRRLAIALLRRLAAWPPEDGSARPPVFQPVR
jgi:hypothetical protein